MKNIHVLPTDKPSRLHYSKVKSDESISYKLVLNQELSKCNDGLLSGQRNIYITSDEDIKEVDWYYLPRTNSVYKCNEDTTELNLERRLGVAKIILTTDPDLIGVQAIDDEFLEWFVKNPSCEYVKVESYINGNVQRIYEIIIPQEEPKLIHQQIIDLVGGIERCKELLGTKPKQETLEEAAENFKNYRGTGYDNIPKLIRECFINGAEWQAERMYQSMKECWYAACAYSIGSHKEFKQTHPNFKEWFEQFKKKQ
jgi:hypothetical protein